MNTTRRKKSTVRGAAGGKGADAPAPRRQRERRGETPAAESTVLPSSRGFLFSQLSHDLRNPLSVVLLNAQVLRRHLPPTAHHYLDAVERGSDELNQMLDELSDAARIEDGRLPTSLTLALTDLPAMVEEAVASSRSAKESRNKQLTVSVHVAEGVGPIACDRARMARVLGCLVGGAVRITPKQGTVAVELGPDGAGGARISVTDGGPAIPEADRASLFDMPSGKTPVASRRATPHGSALTLFVARHVVEAHGGSMTAEHGGEKGTTYIVTLPHGEVDPA